jgi:hypothetical protein
VEEAEEDLEDSEVHLEVEASAAEVDLEDSEDHLEVISEEVDKLHFMPNK